MTDDDRVPAERIEVKLGSGSGWVTLTGAVKSQADSDAAFDAISQLDGVGGITNRIEVVTSGVDG